MTRKEDREKKEEKKEENTAAPPDEERPSPPAQPNLQDMAVDATLTEAPPTVVEGHWGTGLSHTAAYIRITMEEIMKRKDKIHETGKVPLEDLGAFVTAENIHEYAGEEAAPLRDSLEDLLQLPEAAPEATVDVKALAAVWAALEGHLAPGQAGEALKQAYRHLCRLLADEDLRWVLENRPRAALKWLAHLMDELLEPAALDAGPGEDAGEDAGDEDQDGEDELDDLDDDGLEELDRAAIRQRLDRGKMEALPTGRGAWYLSGRPRARASREAAMTACRLWAALETSLLRDFERQEIQPLFVEFRALCRDRHFQQVLEACPEAAAKWFHALTFQDDEGMGTKEEA